MKKRTLLKSLAVAGLLFPAGLYLWRNRWRYIVVHHSAGTFGDIAFLQKVHRQRQAGDPIDAIPYHYIIGNGRGLPMGEVASDWRQEYDIWGAHVSHNNADRNARGIGICLIGNLEEHPLPEPQYQALLILVKRLMQRYHISPENIAGHGHVNGESTLCPGKYFPRERFLKDVKSA